MAIIVDRDTGKHWTIKYGKSRWLGTDIAYVAKLHTNGDKYSKPWYARPLNVFGRALVTPGICVAQRQTDGTLDHSAA